MQRLPDHMRDMLATRNPQDGWKKTMAKKRKEDLEYHLHYAVMLMQREKNGVSTKIVQMVHDLNHELANTLRREFQTPEDIAEMHYQRALKELNKT